MGAGRGWSRPTSVLPGVAPLELVLARTDDIAVAIPVLLGYPNGFEFHLAIRLRSAGEEHQLPPLLHGMPGPGGRLATGDMLRLAVVYGDGRAATNLGLRHRMPEADGGLHLFPEGGGGGGGSYDMRYWVHPLPPPGSVTLIGEWPRFGVPETRVEVPAQTVLDASARAVSLWPEPEDEVYEPADLMPEPLEAGPGAAATVAAYTSGLNLSFDPEGAAAPATGTANPEQRD
ncbi:MAG: hypothetical protein IRY85_22155 [Micromonosporaceae bacterium]|nr:hypothetical protein [Micromonosporaceae bacterium]